MSLTCLNSLNNIVNDLWFDVKRITLENKKKSLEHNYFILFRAAQMRNKT